MKPLKKISLAMLSVLGVSSCDSIIGGAICMYGTPTAGYEIKGKVTDESGKPVESIRVAAKYTQKNDGQYSHTNIVTDTVYTDKSGSYKSLVKDFPMDYDVEVKFEDVDGAENGEYETQTVTSDTKSFTHSKKDADEWYKGTYSTTIEAKLKNR